MFFPYRHSNVPLARELRKNATPWEQQLWHHFLKKYPVRFQRQKTIGNFIADFYCAKAKLVIELDGNPHFEEEQKQKDILRTKELEAYGLKILRFRNSDVEKHFDKVCQTIDQIVIERKFL